MFFHCSGKEEAVYNALNKIEHLNVYKKEEIPREYFYTWNNRIQPIVIAADLGYNIIQSAENTTLSKSFAIQTVDSTVMNRETVSHSFVKLKT